MEMEFFVKPGTDEEWYQYWLDERTRWYIDLGITPENLAISSTQSSPITRSARSISSSGLVSSAASGVSSRASPTGPTSPLYTHTSASICPTSTRQPASGISRTVIRACGRPRARSSVDAYDEDEAPNTKGGGRQNVGCCGSTLG